MKKIVILFVTLLLVSVISMSSLISIYAYCGEENTTTDETNVTTEEENSAYSSRSSIVEGGGEINGELWYGIKLDTEDKPIITYDIDYSNSHLLEYLKPGDIVYERNAGFDVVDFLGHIAMVIEVVQATPTQPGYVLMIESLPSVINNPYTGEPRKLGVCYSIMTPTRFDEKHVSIMRVKNATDAQIQEAINWAVSKLNCEWRFPINKYIDDNDDDKAWYCSELVWAAYCLQNIHLVGNNILPVAPEDIYESNEVATILDHRADEEDYYDTDFINKTDTHHTYSCDGDTYTEEHDYEVYNYCYEKCRACGYQRQAQEHEYTYRYNSLNSTTHYAYCECGARKGESHVFNVVGEYKICEECNYQIETNHVHSYTYTPLLKGKSHRKECSCGDSVIEGCFGEAIFGEDSVCRWCGETIKSGQGLLSLENEDALPNSKEDDEKVEYNT